MFLVQPQERIKSNDCQLTSQDGGDQFIFRKLGVCNEKNGCMRKRMMRCSKDVLEKALEAKSDPAARSLPNQSAKRRRLPELLLSLNL